MTYNQYEKWKKWKIFYENILGVYKDKTHLNIVFLGIKIKIKNQSQTIAGVERVISLTAYRMKVCRYNKSDIIVKILKRVQNDKVVEVIRLFCENGLQRQLLLTQTLNARIIKVA